MTDENPWNKIKVTKMKRSNADQRALRLEYICEPFDAYMKDRKGEGKKERERDKRDNDGLRSRRTQSHPTPYCAP